MGRGSGADVVNKVLGVMKIKKGYTGEGISFRMPYIIADFLNQMIFAFFSSASICCCTL